MKNLIYRVAAVLSTIMAILVWSAACQAQVQVLPVRDCCEQAIEYKQQLDQMTAKYQDAVNLLNQTRKAGDQVQHQKEARIDAVKDEANTKLTEANNQQKATAAALKASDGKLLSLKSDLTDELMRSRFLGWGRKRWIRQTLKKLQ